MADRIRTAVVDFDETLIDLDSFSYMMRREKWFCRPAVTWAGVGLSLSLVTHRREGEARSRFKEKLLGLYGEMEERKKQDYIRVFRGHLNRPLLDCIQKDHYDEIVILSASEEGLIARVLEGELSCTAVIANSLERRPFTTCWGPEKVRRLKEWMDENPVPGCSAGESGRLLTSYSDSDSDAPLLELSEHAYRVTGTEVRRIR